MVEHELITTSATNQGRVLNEADVKFFMAQRTHLLLIGIEVSTEVTTT